MENNTSKSSSSKPPPNRLRRRCTRTYKCSIKLMSALLLPLILAIFTVVITFEQKRESDQQRFEDRELGREQRQQDLNVSLEQRNLERQLADDRKNQENDLAAIHRNMLQAQRHHELEIEKERYETEKTKYLETLLATYLNEIGQLLEKNNGSLTNNPSTHALARAKTLHVLELIGPKRASQIISFLYEAKQLTTNKQPLDMTSALLKGIDLRGGAFKTRLCLVGASLINATFSGQNLTQSDFSRAQLTGANFSDSKCDQVIFDSATLVRADFSRTSLMYATFRQVDLTKATFVSAQSDGTLFYKSIMERTNFTHAQFRSSESFNFTLCRLTESSFYNATFTAVIMDYVNLTHTNFSHASLDKAQFLRSALAYTDLRHATLRRARFLYSDLSHANLTGSTFHDFFHDHVWNEVLSLYQTIMPNGSVSDHQPLVQNGHASCSNESLKEWYFIGFKSVELIRLTSKKCVFAPLHKSKDVKMSQSVKLPAIYQRFLLSHGRIVLKVKAHLGWRTQLTIQGQTDAPAYLNIISRVQKDFLTDEFVYLHDSTENALEIIVDFPPTENPISDSIWLEYIELTIVPSVY